MTAWAGGHFFVGLDNIYFLEYGKPSAEPIGTAFFRDIKARNPNLSGVYVVTDPLTETIMFAFPFTDRIQEIWNFNLKTKEWTTSSLTVESISFNIVHDIVDWDSPTSDWDNADATYPFWDSTLSKGENPVVVYGQGGRLWAAYNAAETDFSVDAARIRVVLETGDIDFGAPDTNKTMLRLSLKIDRLVDALDLISFTVSISTTKGRRWRALGTLRISPETDEGKIDFRATGSHFRLRLESTSLTPNFSVTEYGLLVVGSGDELALPDTEG
ncbi:MAG: hypothetical protein HC888_02695 [Candidatus Competibacteraceae bacterium]|nr:hypothetical protein [Candidatus Competibacteraceae bacterium]